MARIAAESRRFHPQEAVIRIRRIGRNRSNAEILADAAYHAARESGAKAIVVFTSPAPAPAWSRATARRWASLPSRRTTPRRASYPSTTV